MQSCLCRARSYVGKRTDIRRHIVDVTPTSKINFALFDSWVLLHGTREYLGVYTELAQGHVIRQSVSWKRLRNMETAEFIMTVLNAYYYCATKMYSANESAFLLLKNKYITYNLMFGWPCNVIQCEKEKPTRYQLCILYFYSNSCSTCSTATTTTVIATTSAHSAKAAPYR